MNTKTAFVVLAIVVLAGAGYWAYAGKGPGAAPSPQDTTNQTQVPVTSADGVAPGSGGIHGMEPEPAAAAARADLAAKLGITANEITIMLVEDRTWPDGCLGLGGPAESCLAALVEGFRVEMRAKGREYVYRTDRTGASLRMEGSAQSAVQPERVSVVGYWECLPKKGDGPHTAECAFGIALDQSDGHLAINTALMSTYPVDYPTGTKLRVSGVIHPAESTTSYDIDGVLWATTIEKI